MLISDRLIARIPSTKRGEWNHPPSQPTVRVTRDRT